MKVLIVDCYDSFTYNLVQQVGMLGAEPITVTCDTPREKLEELDFDRVILSPGPGTPERSGLCLDVLKSVSREVPTLGVCLGHQAITISFGGNVVRAKNLMHGKVSQITHDGTGIFESLPSPFPATRYHSLIADPGTFPSDLEVTARSSDDGYIMGLRHRKYPIYGVQFHPESIFTPGGTSLMKNFLYGEVA